MAGREPLRVGSNAISDLDAIRKRIFPYSDAELLVGYGSECAAWRIDTRPESLGRFTMLSAQISGGTYASDVVKVDNQFGGRSRATRIVCGDTWWLEGREGDRAANLDERDPTKTREAFVPELLVFAALAKRDRGTFGKEYANAALLLAEEIMARDKFVQDFLSGDLPEAPEGEYEFPRLAWRDGGFWVR